MSAELQLLPLLVVLVIVACFLLTRFSATGELTCTCRPVDVPWAVNGEELVLAPVVVKRSGEALVVNGRSVRPDELTAALTALAEQHAEFAALVDDPPRPLTVLLAAEKDTSFGELRPLFDAAREVGAATISLVVLRPT